MKHILHALLIVIVVFLNSVSSQAQMISATPNYVEPGQTLNTTISATNYYFTGASVQFFGAETWLNGPSFIYGVVNSILGVDSSQADATYVIPANAPHGYYSIGVSLSNGFPEPELANAIRVGSFNVKGYVFNDLNLNGIKNIGEPGIPNQQVLVLPDNVYVTTNGQGIYEFIGVDNNSYTLKWDPDPAYMLIAPDSINVTLTNYLTNKNFGIHTPIDGTITGHIWHDLNGDGIEDVGEAPYANHPVSILPDNVITYTNANGDFTYGGAFNVNYTVSAPSESGWSTTSTPASYSFVFTGDVTNIDFGVSGPPPTIGLQTIVQHTWAACFTPKLFYIKIKNIGSAYIDTGYVKFFWPNYSPLDSAYPAPDVINGDTLYWYYSDLPVGATKTFYAWLYIPGPGIVLDAYAFAYGIYEAEGISGFSQGFDGDLVTCAYDPNDKEASVDTITVLDVPIDYIIRFQNTGTDSAHNIVVRDTLSSLLDWNTFEYLLSSHDGINVQFNPTNGAIAFIYDNIFLPDSNVNEPASHGQVSYRVYPSNTVPIGTIIHNTASIYFDANPPIVTNDATVTYCNKDTLTNSQEICEGDSVQIGSTWYSSAGLYTFHSSSPAVCDILNIVDLTVMPLANNAVIVEDSLLTAASGASAYQWYDCNTNTPIPGATSSSFLPTISGSYSVQVTGASGCNAMSSCYDITLCAPQFVQEGYEMCSGDSVDVNGVWLTQAGSYVNTYSAANGCDSIVTTILTVDTFDTALQANGMTLTSMQTTGFYQWYDCNLNQNILGATQQTFTTTTDGSYAVIISNAIGCSIMSECIALVGIEDVVNASISISPNPATNAVLVSHPNHLRQAFISLHDLTGRLIANMPIDITGQTLLQLYDVAAGTYFITLTSETRTLTTQKLTVIK